MTKMKKIMNLLLAASLVTFAACSQNDTDNQPAGPVVEPDFPEAVMQTITMSDGEPAEFKLTPNMAWTVSVPDTEEAALYFKVEVNGNELIGSSRSGEAGTEVTVTVAGKMEDFEKAHTLELSLTMGGQTKPFAQVTLAPAESWFDARTAVAADGDRFLYDDDRNLVFPDSARLDNGDEIRLLFDHRNYLRVTSNREWVAEAPEWLSMSTRGGKQGEVSEIELSVPDRMLPFDDSEGRVKFSTTDNTPLAEYAIRIDGCAGMFEAAVKNAAGVTLTASEGTTDGSVTAAYGSKVFFACAGGEQWIDFVEGKGFTGSAWSDAEKAAGLHTREFTAQYSANPTYGEPRYAFLFCVPRSAAEGLDESEALDADGEVNEAFADYLIASYTQNYPEKPRDNNKLNVQLMVGQDDSSSSGQEMFAQVEEFPDAENFPEGWWSSEIRDMPVVFKLTLRDMDYCKNAVMKLTNAEDFEIVYAPEDRDNEWIDEFGQREDSDLYRFIFKYEEKTGPGDVTEVEFMRPNVPSAYVICKMDDAVTGALIVEVDQEALDIPLQNVTAGNGTDIGFSVLAAGQTGYSEAYRSVPQYKVNGYGKGGQPDAEGRVRASVLILTFSDNYDIDLDNLKFEAIENGVLTGSMDENDKDYILDGKPMRWNPVQVQLTLGGDGPNQFRVLCNDRNGKLVCTIYIYHHWYN